MDVFNYGKFAQDQKANTVLCTAAVSTLDPAAPTNVQQIAVAGVNGALLTQLRFVPLATTVAGTYYLFTSTNGGGAKRQEKGVYAGILTANAGSTGNPEVVFEWSRDNPLPLAPNEILYVGISFALGAGVNACMRWVDF